MTCIFVFDKTSIHNENWLSDNLLSNVNEMSNWQWAIDNLIFIDFHQLPNKLQKRNTAIFVNNVKNYNNLKFDESQQKQEAK